MSIPESVVPTPFDEVAVERLVRHFYSRVREDALLGPLFNAAVHDWESHFEVLVRFWCSVALKAASYRGNPMGVHRALQGIGPQHFERWLALWKHATEAELAPADAASMQEYAQRIANSLRYGLGIGNRARSLGLPLIG